MLLKSQIFNNFSFKLILISSIFCVILSFFLSEFAQNLLIFSGILSFGIIHGANDILLLKKNTKNNDDSSLNLLIKFIINYLKNQTYDFSEHGSNDSFLLDFVFVIV